MARKTRNLRARLPSDLVARASRLPLSELCSSGMMREIVERVVNHVHATTGATTLPAYVGLVVHDPDGPDGPEPGHEVAVARYPARSAQVCRAQATVCVHPIGCRDICAALDSGNGEWMALEPGDVHVTVYPTKGADAAAHQLTWTDSRCAVPCACLKILLVAG